tara:strand:+ start:121 stop:609 length:489 start_codon:yes stop_codon:yes gene_type:complete
MANKKITALTELSAGDRATTDVIPIVDVSGTATTKKITVANLVSATSAGALSSYDFGGNAISGFDATLNDQTGTAYTLLASDNGKVVVLNNSSAVTVTVPSGLGAGFNCSFVQKGAGQVSFSASGTTIYNRQSHTKIKAQYGVASLLAYAANVFVLAGDTDS